VGSLGQAILAALEEREKPGMQVPTTSLVVAEDLALAEYQRTGDFPDVGETRVRAVRRALEALWGRGLVDKSYVTWAGSDASVRRGSVTWRIHDDDRPAEPDETTRDPYGRWQRDEADQ
jgi:hypothetical protein